MRKIRIRVLSGRLDKGRDRGQNGERKIIEELEYIRLKEGVKRSL